MATDVSSQLNNISNKYLVQNGAQAPVSTASSINIPIGQTSEQQSLELVQTTTGSESRTQKRTKNELYESIKGLCNSYGLDFEEAKRIGLLSSISGLSEEELLNADDVVIQKAIKDLDASIKAIYEDIYGVKSGKRALTFDLIKNYDKLINDKILPAGWFNGSKNIDEAIKTFRNRQKRIREHKNGEILTSAESLSERLKVMYGCEVKNLTSEQLADFLERYFHDYFNEIKNDPTKSIESIRNLQLTDFSKMLFNSSSEEYEMFIEALQFLVRKNRDDGYQAILDSFETDAERIGFQKKIGSEKLRETIMASSQDGDIITPEDVASFMAVGLSYRSGEDLENYHNTRYNEASDFYTETNLSILAEIKNDPNIIKNIKEKLVNGEVLTEKEQKYLDVLTEDSFYRGDNSGQIIAVGNSNIIEKNEQKELLETINADAYAISEKAGSDYYKDVLGLVSDYAQNLPEEERAAFSDLMEEALGENYTNISNGIEAELVKPSRPDATAATADSETVTSSSGNVQNSNFGYKNNKNNIDNISPQETAKRLYEECLVEEDPVTAVAPKAAPRAKYNPIKFIKELNKDNGIVQTVLEVYSKFSQVSQGVKIYINKLYSMLTPEKQEEVLRSLTSGAAFSELLSETDDNTILKLKNNFNNHYINELLEEKQEEVQEELA